MHDTVELDKQLGTLFPLMTLWGTAIEVGGCAFPHFVKLKREAQNSPEGLRHALEMAFMYQEIDKAKTPLCVSELWPSHPTQRQNRIKRLEEELAL